MSIELLYSGTPELADGFSLDAFPQINANLQYLNSAIVPSIRGNTQASLLFYAKHTTWAFYRTVWPETSSAFSRPDQTTNYNFPALDYGLSFSLEEFDRTTLRRHPAPLGTANGNLLLPSYRDFPRTPCVPILTIKSSIRTNSKSLRFKTIQRFGNPQKTTISGGQGPEVTVLPIGPGVAWNTPATPIQVNSDPQWGDRTNADDIDSFGTTALHIKIFEQWPIRDTFYLTQYFTVLHYNDYVSRTQTMKRYDEEKKSLVDVLNDEDKPVFYVSPLDFKVPTTKNPNPDPNAPRTEMIVGTEFTKEDDVLEKFSLWNNDVQRRGQLLSGGGYAYFRNAIFVANVYFDEDEKDDRTGVTLSSKGAWGGSGYKEGDELVYQDGSILKVTSVGEVTLTDGSKLTGSITNFDFEPNYSYGNDIVIDMTNFTYITSVDSVTPVGGSGSGAKMKLIFTIGRIIGHDPGPKEVTPITRITKPSNRGADIVYGELITTVELQDTNSKDFDIFYYFHNDPCTYSIASPLFASPDAQYVISEVDPA